MFKKNFIKFKNLFKRPCKHDYVYRWNDDLSKVAMTCTECGFFKIVSAVDPEYKKDPKTPQRHVKNNVVSIDFSKDNAS